MSQFKKITCTVLLLTMLLSLIGIADASSTLSVNRSCLILQPTGTSYSALTVTASGTWTATSNVSWLTLVCGANVGSSVTGTDSQTLTIGISGNTSATSNRNAQITITQGSTSIYIPVVQLSKTTISYTAVSHPNAIIPTANTEGKAYVTADYASQSITLHFSGNQSATRKFSTSAASYSVSSGSDWLSIISVSDYSIYIQVDTNASASSRTGSITYTCNGTSGTMTVVQAACPSYNSMFDRTSSIWLLNSSYSSTVTNLLKSMQREAYLGGDTEKAIGYQLAIDSMNYYGEPYTSYDCCGLVWAVTDNTLFDVPSVGSVNYFSRFRTLCMSQDDGLSHSGACMLYNGCLDIDSSAMISVTTPSAAIGLESGTLVFWTTTNGNGDYVKHVAIKLFDYTYGSTTKAIVIEASSSSNAVVIRSVWESSSYYLFKAFPLHNYTCN